MAKVLEPAAEPYVESNHDSGQNARDALRVLIMNVDLPQFPGRAGHEFLNTTGLARLAEAVGLVSLVHTPEQKSHLPSLESADVDLYLWTSNGTASNDSVQHTRSIRRRIVRSGLRYVFEALKSLDPRPRDVFIQDLQFRNMAAALTQALAAKRWQVLVVIQSSSAAWLDYVPRFPARVLVLHDVRSLLFWRKARAASSLRERATYMLEALRYRSFERRYCQKADLVVTVSPDDEAWVRKHYEPKRVLTIPIPVDWTYFAPSEVDETAPNRIVFTGTMDHPPNVDAACFFAETVLPLIRQSVPNAEFWIVGRDPTPSIYALQSLPGVVVTGFVPDIRHYLAQATVVVVPIRYGSGMRNKILEAWGMQKCVVSTRIGAEGLVYENGRNILIADGAEALAATVSQALRDPELRDRVRYDGQRVVTRTHAPDVIATAYREALTSALDVPRRVDEPMHVLIDLRWMRPGVAGGIENHTRSFLRRLVHLDAINQYRLLVPPAVRFDFDLRQRRNFRIVPLTGPGRDVGVAAWRLARVAHELAELDYWRSAEVEAVHRLRELDCDVALSMPGYMHPELYPLTNVLVVPDIQHEYHPEFFAPDKLEERRRVYGDSIKRAVHLCADSEFTRQSLIERLGVPPDRVTTTYLAADPSFEPGSPARGHAAAVLRKYGLPIGQYLLFPANTWPHKNHRAALEALRILEDDYRLAPLLVCTGAPKEAQLELLEDIERLNLRERVQFLGYCPHDDLPALYEGAAALVFPSFFEGFGMPVLEAMWCDCPVVCSNTSSLPEIVGDAAVLADPKSPAELASALNRVLSSAQLRQTLIENGRRQARRFSWDKYTLETVRILREARNQAFGWGG